MDGHTALDEMVDNEARWRIADAVAAATTFEEVAAIRATCEHRYKTNSHECWICGHAQSADELEADNIPF